MVSMNRLSTERRAQVIGCLVEGMSIRGTVRVTGVAKNTVAKLLLDLGEACSVYMDETLRDLPCEVVECDEIWSFVGAKAKNVMEHHPEEYGDAWTWVAIDADSKLVATWLVGPRTIDAGIDFLTDLAHRFRYRIQLSTDALQAYREAVDIAFQGEVDFAQIHKSYGRDPALAYSPERNYSPAKCNGVDVKVRIGHPDPDRISTSYIERQNLTMRMGMRRSNRQELWMRNRCQAATDPDFDVRRILLASVGSFLSCSLPSMNNAPARTRATSSAPATLRQRSWTASRSL